MDLITVPIEEEESKDWDKIKGNFFDYYNVDVKLLILQVLLEGYYRGQKNFTLDEFLKGNYWKVEEINEELRDSNDYGSAEDLVLVQVVSMIKDLKLGSIVSIQVNRLSSLIESVVKDAIKSKDDSDENVGYYDAMIREMYDLKKIADEKFKRDIEMGKEYKSFAHDTAVFTEDDYWRHLEYITALSAPYIVIEVSFNNQNAKLIHQNIRDYIDSFASDTFIDDVPIYKQKRYYFSKQLENFYQYIKALPALNNYVNIPFSALAEQGFEVIKVMSYLEDQERIKVRNWNDTELWNVRFNTVPVTLDSLLGHVVQSNDMDTIIEHPKDKLKLNLSFAMQTGILTLVDQDGNEYKVKVQGQVQREVLRVIFRKPENTYSDWSLYEISEVLGADDVDETSVKNAIYQFNRKVKLKITWVENIFELTKHSARFNPKYVNKN